MVVLLVFLTMSCALGYHFGQPLWIKVAGARTVADVVGKYGPTVEPVLLRHFRQAGLSYPPKALAFLAFKEEKSLEIWGRDDGDWKRVKTYPILAASGADGPKLKQGDRQVPEGIYRIEGLNPNSRFHLSMKVNYPNAFDREKAQSDGRTNLGGDIFIHGRAVSTGCLAMGDDAIEELFVLASRVGASNIQVIIAPRDMRRLAEPVVDNPVWLSELYGHIRAALMPFNDGRLPEE